MNGATPLSSADPDNRRPPRRGGSAASGPAPPRRPGASPCAARRSRRGPASAGRRRRTPAAAGRAAQRQVRGSSPSRGGSTTHRVRPRSRGRSPTPRTSGASGTLRRPRATAARIRVAGQHRARARHQAAGEVAGARVQLQHAPGLAAPRASVTAATSAAFAAGPTWANAPGGHAQRPPARLGTSGQPAASSRSTVRGERLRRGQPNHPPADGARPPHRSRPACTSQPTASSAPECRAPPPAAQPGKRRGQRRGQQRARRDIHDVVRSPGPKAKRRAPPGQPRPPAGRAPDSHTPGPPPAPGPPACPARATTIAPLAARCSPSSTCCHWQPPQRPNSGQGGCTRRARPLDRRPARPRPPAPPPPSRARTRSPGAASGTKVTRPSASPPLLPPDRVAAGRQPGISTRTSVLEESLPAAGRPQVPVSSGIPAPAPA